MKSKLSKFWYYSVKFFTSLAARIYFRVHVEGSENYPTDGPFLLLSSHQSFFDPVICTLSTKRELCFMARDTLFNNKVFGGLIRSLNAIPVRRGEADVAAMKRIIEKLKEGYGICLFPEGTRTTDGKIAHIKPGFTLLCRRGKAAAVPVVVDGLHELWPKGKKFPRPGKIGIKVGKPISCEEIKKMGDEKFADHMTEVYRSMQNELREKLGREPIIYEDINNEC